MHQHHAVVGQPDGAVLLGKADEFAQVVRRRILNCRHFVSLFYVPATFAIVQLSGPYILLPIAAELLCEI
jgi:hypothetical protein